MGEVRVQIELENYVDRDLAEQGRLPADQVRRHTMVAVADTGARMLALPQDVTDVLGVRQVRTTVVAYADGRREELPIVAPIMLRMAGRHMITEAIVLPPTYEALIGQIPLEGTDLHVDCGGQRLVPNPISPIYPLMDLK